MTVENGTAANPQSAANDIEVTAPGEGNLGKAKVQPGGTLNVTKGEKTTSYTVPEATAGGSETVFGFDDQGNVTVEMGAISLEKKDDSIGFGDATLAKGSEGEDKITVTADENSDRAKVKVPAGETLTVTDKDGKEHTYTNNGSGPLELEVDKDGNVYVEKLPDNGLKLGPDAPIIVEDADGENDNPLIAGKGGATLKPHEGNYEGDANKNNPPLLSDGSIIFPPEGGKSNVKVPGAAPEEKRLEGKDVEITVKDGEVTAEAVPGSGNGKVTVENSTEYTIPEGEGAAELNDKGVFGAPAQGRITDNKDGPGSHPYVLRPADNNQQLFTLEAEGGNESGVHMEPDASFTIHEKVDRNSEEKGDENLKTAIGEYTAGEGGADVTVDHKKGSVTLKSGTLTVEDTNKTPEGGTTETDSKGAFVLIPGENAGESVELTTKSGGEMTVTAPGEGYKDGADVVVPSNESVTVGDKTYKNSGSGELELHVKPDGKVELKSGKVELGKDDSITVNGVTHTGPATVEKTPTGSGTDNKSTDDSDKLNVDANSGDKVNVDGQVYEADGTGVQLTVDKKTGDVTLEQGKLKVSEGNDTADSGLKVQTDTGTGTGKDYTVAGDAGVEVEKDNEGDVTVTVPNGDAAGNKKDVTVTGPAEGQTNKYTNESETGEDLVVELTDEGPVLKDGKAGLGEGSSIVVAPGSDGRKPATVESTKDGDGDKKVTVEKSTDGKSTTVDIPDGGKAKVNGVEVEGPAKVVIDEDGTAHVTPEGEGNNKVKIGGRTYNKKEEASKDASVTITPDGTVTPDKVDDFIIEIVPDPDTVIELRPGETVTFDVGGKKTTLTGGDEGGFVKVDKDGTVTVTDESGEKDYGKYQNAGADGSKLELEISGESTELKGGTVRYGTDDVVKLGDSEYKAGSQGATLSYDKDAEGEDENVPTLEGGSVKLDETADGTKLKVKTGDEQAEMTGKNVEVFADGGNGNPAVVGTEASKSGEVKMNSHIYGVPSGNTKSPVEGSGTSAELGAPATGQVSDKLGEPGDTYVIVPKDTGNIYGGDRTGGKSGMIRDWLIPANPAYYDLEKALRQDMDRPFIWKQSSNISVGDRVYIYMAAPERRIRYKCEAVEVNIPHAYEDGNVAMKRVMRLKLLRRYDNQKIGVDMLRDHGVYAVRGPRSMPGSLIEEIERIYGK